MNGLEEQIKKIDNLSKRNSKDIWIIGGLSILNVCTAGFLLITNKISWFIYIPWTIFSIVFQMISGHIILKRWDTFRKQRRNQCSIS